MSPGAAPGAAAARRGPVALPTPPKGWPIGSYPTYAEAQAAAQAALQPHVAPLQALPWQQCSVR